MPVVEDLAGVVKQQILAAIDFASIDADFHQPIRHGFAWVIRILLVTPNPVHTESSPVVTGA